LVPNFILSIDSIATGSHKPYDIAKYGKGCVSLTTATTSFVTHSCVPEERPYGSKALINACKEHKYIKQFAKRNRIRREVYERLLARWSELGFKFPPPEIRNFEEDETGTAPRKPDAPGTITL
jgi:hypothetical protein